MKKVMLLTVAVVFIISLFAIGYAEDQSVYEPEYGRLMPGFLIDRDQVPYRTSPANKLERGVVNLATFWLEIPAEMTKTAKAQDPLAGATVGMANGVLASVMRAGTAIFDIYSFMSPSYTTPAMKPEYAWQAADEHFRALLW